MDGKRYLNGVLYHRAVQESRTSDRQESSFRAENPRGKRSAWLFGGELKFRYHIGQAQSIPSLNVQGGPPAEDHRRAKRYPKIVAKARVDD